MTNYTPYLNVNKNTSAVLISAVEVIIIAIIILLLGKQQGPL